ncbi:ABC transporter ATP-binding protein [Halogeometricum limi]|uniref:ABC-type D-xylose/L-arabinose transporter n=1 Tax=Halogeometricum limi TaxID=555875 RepID=A0A1I6I9W8_9EURY|nr:ABC transporter ATP-binding protein [Halogeometricum limi]SFR63493.1 multiple sugar transport system ATP-binding protein [Halogeometricum limi]
MQEQDRDTRSSADGTERPHRDDRTPTDGVVGEAGGETVELSSLSKRFGDEEAVDGVSLSISEGELLVLLGPSGCGKTTTLRMIAGLESVSGGSVAIGGVDVSEHPPQDRDVAMVFQNYALYPHKTVRENIRFPLRKTDLSKAEQRERIESTAALLDIADLLDKEPAALSGGQRQRVAIGRAIGREPSVLLMDEPLSNLDAKLRVRTRSELRSLQQRLGITTVYVTHDQEEAMSIADRIAIMNDGRVEQVGTPEEVYEDPTSAFIAGFLGDPSMNLLPTSVGPSRDGDTGGTERGDELAAGLAAAVPDDAARVGVRPEDLFLVDGSGSVVGDGPANVSDVYDCDVHVVEPIGRAYELTLSTAAGPVVLRARTVPDELRGRDRVGVVYDRDSLYAFDADGGRLRRGGNGW